jgi:hypothetical protein
VSLLNKDPSEYSTGWRVRFALDEELLEGLDPEFGLEEGFVADDDTVAFFGQIETTFGGLPVGPTGLFIDRNGDLQNVAVEGRAIPAMPGASYSLL